MQALLVAIIGWALASMLTRILVGAGLTFVTYIGISDLVESSLDALTSSIGAMGDAAQILYLAGVGEAISIMGSAIIAAATMYAARLFLARS